MGTKKLCKIEKFKIFSSSFSYSFSSSVGLRTKAPPLHSRTRGRRPPVGRSLDVNGDVDRSREAGGSCEGGTKGSKNWREI